MKFWKTAAIPTQSRLRTYLTSAAGLMLGLGMCLELMMSVSTLLIRSFHRSESLLSQRVFDIIAPHWLFVLNSCVGFCGALLIVAGALKLARSLRVSPRSRNWLYVASAFYLAYRSFDILQSYRWLFIQSVFGMLWDLDLYISGLLLVASCLSLLIGLVRALVYADSSNRILENQNIILDYQVRQCHRLEEESRSS